MKHLFILCSFVLVLFACKRRGEPVPEICASKTSYELGDTIRVDNCSKRYTKQRWVLPDGTPSTANQVYYVPGAPGTYTFRLFVSNDDFVNEYDVIKNVTVNP